MTEPAKPGPDGGGTPQQAKEVCLRLLTDRARSRAELADRLARKGFRPDVAEQALDRLAAVGLIDDAEFARQWVTSRHAHAGRGRRSLAVELRRKGIGPAESAAALAEVSPDDERARAAELVRRKLRTATVPADRAERDRLVRRLVGMLARRGYDGSVAIGVVRAELDRAQLDTEGLDTEE